MITLAVVSVRKANLSASSVLKVTPERSVTWPRSARIQPFSETTTVIGSRPTIASSIAASSRAGAIPEAGGRFANVGFWTEFFPDLLDLSRNRFPLLGQRSDQCLEPGVLFAQRLFLGANFHLLKLAQVA